MTGKNWFTCCAIAFFPVAFLGCAASLDSIPTGRWQGEGQWITWKKNDQGKLERLSGRYRTSVTITKKQSSGHDMMVVGVVSDHRADPAFGNAGVRVFMTLIKSAQYADGSLACDTRADVSTCDGSDSPELNEVVLKRLLDQQPVPPARLSRLGWLQILEVSYQPVEKSSSQTHFAETFTFDGNRLIKQGYYGDTTQRETIRWTERLQLCDQPTTLPTPILPQGNSGESDLHGAVRATDKLPLPAELGPSMATNPRILVD